MTIVNSTNTHLVDGCELLKDALYSPLFVAYMDRYNEHTRLAERRTEFNVDALKSTVARSLQRSDTDIKCLSKIGGRGAQPCPSNHHA